MRLLYERESFLIFFSSDFGFWRQEIGYNVRSSYGSPASHYKAVFVSRSDS
jgi:hypothetical protein